MLGVLVILTLVPTWTDGVLLTKCELRSKLKAVFPEFPEETSDDHVAKLASMIESISGFNTNLVTITSFNSETLIRAPFPHDQDSPSGSGFGELSNTPTDIVVNKEPLIAVGDEEFFTKEAEEQPEGSAVYVEGQDRKKREVGSWMSEGSSGEGPTDQPEETMENNGLPSDVYYDTYEMVFGPTELPPETTNHENIIYDTYEMIYGHGAEAPDRANEPEEVYHDNYEKMFGPRNLPPKKSAVHVKGQDRKKREVGSWISDGSSREEPTNQPEETLENNGSPSDVYYDTYEMLFGPTNLPPKTNEPEDIHYDTYEMLYGHGAVAPNRANNPEEVYYDTYEMIFGPRNLPTEKSAVHVEGQDRKKREVGSWISDGSSGEGPTDQPEETLENNGSPGDVYYDTYEMVSGPTDLPPETTDHENIIYDMYEMIFGHGAVPPDTANEPEDKYYNIYNKIFGHRAETPDTTNEPENVHYDTYEMLFGPRGKPLLNRPLDTTGLGHGRSEPRTAFYGIFQLNGVTCYSGTSNSPNLCGLHCNALTDDDITDDIACLKTLNEKGINLTPYRMNVDLSQYFAECG